MAVIPDFATNTINSFLMKNVSMGATIYTDGLKSFVGLEGLGFKHVPRTQPLRSELRRGAKSVVPLADRAIGNLQQWLVGIHHGVSRAQLQVYPRRVRLSAQPSAAAHGSFPNSPWS
jgi:hypothetical protein